MHGEIYEVTQSKSNSSLRVFPRDLHGFGLCCSGARILLRSRGIEWSYFVKNGLTADELRGLNDPHAEELAKWVEEKSNKSAHAGI